MLDRGIFGKCTIAVSSAMGSSYFVVIFSESILFDYSERLREYRYVVSIISIGCNRVFF